eukprot:GHVT01064533.1.p1 GENE.GHVT01064533.1~~GHVT01064533.1.p1  ORF type:complete len:162 (+),score=19.74 GHVT01064533.1:87-572(+)
MDLENGILRGNRRGPFALFRAFGAADSRKALALDGADCRVHFALNCGAQSCPPVSFYTADGLHSELENAAKAFCEDDLNVLPLADSSTLFLSRIFKWYRHDFASSWIKFLEKLLEWSTGEKRRQLQQLLQNSRTPRIRYRPYNWHVQADEVKTFYAGHRAD